jgi:BlaI family transcriptional regulator, penicillinase repressor
VPNEEAIFTERELDVMDILWRHGSGTVGEVKERLSDDLAYTTVLTVLRTLEQKGYVGHVSEGRAYRYHPLVGKEEARESHLRRLTRKLFGGSPELLMAQLVEDRGLTREELERLRRVLDERLG